MTTVLVVDDEFGVAEVLEAILVDEGYRVLTAVNGKQGMESLAREKPDLVLLDFMMPVLDGPGMLRAMAADPHLASIPVILMSSLPEQTVAARVSGHVGFVRKPFSIETVIAAVAKALPPGPRHPSPEP